MFLDNKYIENFKLRLKILQFIKKFIKDINNLTDEVSKYFELQENLKINIKSYIAVHHGDVIFVRNEEGKFSYLGDHMLKLKHILIKAKNLNKNYIFSKAFYLFLGGRE